MGKVSLTLTTTHTTIHDTMKPFVVTLLALAAASAEINVAPGGPSGPNNLMGTSSNIVGQSFLNTALTIVFALVGVSLIIQMITKIMAAPFLQKLFGEARSLDTNTLMDYTNMAMNGIQRMKEIYESLK